MAKVNGMWKVIGIVGTFLIVVIGSAVAYGMLCKAVTDMEPEVKLNTEHRIKFEEKVKHMDENVKKILEILEK